MAKKPNPSNSEQANNIQVDGISFIEHLSFKAFNEGIRLKDCIRLHQKLMKVRVKAVAADSVYANNSNRKFCTRYGISTSFVRKGRAAKDRKSVKYSDRHSAMKGLSVRKEVLVHKTNITCFKDKGKKQEDGNTPDFLWNTYSQHCLYSRKMQKEKSA